jgi:glycosyltransferase involved in cell wall biosynthesis
MDKISVVIPTHNRAHLLERAIKSVQAQTRAVDEIIVVSDGSTDNTDEVVNALKAKDERIRLISYQPAHNGNYARNQGLNAASGDYIAFLDDDDEWLPKKVELQLEVFAQNPEYGLVYTAQNCIFSDVDLTYITKPIGCGDLSQSIFMRNYIGNPSQVMVKAEVLEKTGGFDLELGALQDYDLWVRCCQVTKIGYVSTPCINYYNTSSTNQVSANTEKYIKARRYIAEKYKSITSSFSEPFQKKLAAHNEEKIALRCLRNGRKKDAREFALASIKIKPTKGGIEMFCASFVSYKTMLKLRRFFVHN